MRLLNLAVRVLEQIAQRAVQNAGPSTGQRRRVMPAFEARSRRFDPDELDLFIL